MPLPPLSPRIVRISKDITALLKEHEKTLKGIRTGVTLGWKYLRATKQIEFAILSEDATGRVYSTITHTVDLNDDDHKHLHNGGKIVVVHACGHESHIKI